MNKLTTIFGAAFLTISFNAQAGDCPSLSGKYSIGQADADFNTITEAIEAMMCGGVSGPVEFGIQDGTYDENVVINNIPGADGTNTVTFASKSGNNASTIITHKGAEATVTLNGTNWVAFENITIDHKATAGNAMKIDGKAAHLTFKAVVLDGAEVKGDNNATMYFTSNGPKGDITIEDCEINNGSVGIMKGGDKESDTRTSISASLFFNQTDAGIVMNNEDAPVISNNVVNTLSENKDFKALSLSDAKNNLIISNNIINAANGSYGIALNNCKADVTSYGQICNNSITVGGNNESYGIYLSGRTDNQMFNFNRIKMTASGHKAYYKNTGEGNNVNMMNNIFFDLKTGGYTVIGSTYKDYFNQLPSQSNPALTASANGIMIEKVSPIK